MDIVLVILATLCLLIGFVGCVIPGLPGPPMSYVGLLLLQWSKYAHFSTTALVVWAVVVIVVTVIDFVLTPWMTQRFGGSKAGTWGAILGVVAGLFFPPVGPIIGPFLGALIAELIIARRQSGDATKAALGSFISFIVGTGIKLMACGCMLAHALIVLF